MEPLYDATSLRPVLERLARKYVEGIPIDPGLGLNSVAAEMFMQVDGKKSLAEIGACIAAEYDAPADQCLSDVMRLMAELLDEGAVRVVVPGPGA